MDKKTFAIGFTVFMIGLAVYLWSHNNEVASIIANDGWIGILYYIISNPAYILLFFSIVAFNAERGFIKNTLGAIAITYASDILSFPRMPPEGFPTGNIAILASSDGLVIQELMKFGLIYSYAWTAYYLVMPIILTLFAIDILGFTNFYRAFVKKGG